MKVLLGGIGLALLLATGVRADGTDAEPTREKRMASAREKLYRSHGGSLHGAFFGERLEWRGDDEAVLWDLEGWYGGDLQRLWIETEGLTSDGDGEDEIEVQALYGRAISSFWDFRVGVRHDLEPAPTRTFLSVGFQGLAPQWFEVDAALFLSEDGDLSAQVEAEYDLWLTQRAVLQPRGEVELSADDVPEVGVGSGVSELEVGLRLRYEVRRQFAPYVGWSWSRKTGDTADFARAMGESPRESSWVIGLRFWY